MEQNDSKNLILAMVLSLAILFGWFTFFGPDPEAVPQEQAQAGDAATGDVAAPADVQNALLPRSEAIKEAERVVIDSPRLEGSISLVGGRLDDLTLKDYDETIEEGSPKVDLLSPQDTAQSYFVQTRFLPGEGASNEDVPSNDTVWTLKSGDVLSKDSPVVLGWTSPKGLEFEREFSVDENYMFKLTERVNNKSASDVVLRPFAYVSYLGEDSRVEPVTATRGQQSGFILHQGAIRNIDGAIKESKFKDIQDGDVREVPGVHEISDNVAEKGWTGLTTKYWMTVLIPQSGEAHISKLRYVEATDTYSAEAYFEPTSIGAGESYEDSLLIFSGAKEVELIRDYRDALGIDRFDDTVDWGWFYFLTKPMFSLLHWLYGLIGNMGLAIIGLTFVVKAILFPLAYKSFVSMSRMKKLQPHMERIKEQAGDDRMKMQQMTMELYRQEKVNPVAGCLPILLQIPIFFSLYKVLYVTTELRHAAFFGPWQDLSAPDPTSIMNLFGLLPWGGPDPNSILSLVFLGILALLLGVSMYLTQKLNPTPTDPTQATIFKWMPWVFMFMMGGFAAGLLIYWITNNTLTFIQQYTIMTREGVKPNILGNMFSKKKAG